MPGFPTSLPDSRVPDPATAPPLRWGILATGGIARTFVTALAAHTTQRVVAVGSRSAERARAFAGAHGIEHAHGSYDALVGDPDVDVVYVATPHSEHRDNALSAIAAGKHVLVEKSFTRNAAEAAEVFEAARSAGVFVMEAMWARFLPQMDVLRQLLADGALGDIAVVAADHGQYFDFDPAHRLFNPDLAGGAMLDLGIYPVSFAAMVLGAPEAVTATGTVTSTGVDAQVAMVLDKGAAQAVLYTTLLAATPTTAAVSGTVARADLSGRFYSPGTLTITSRDGSVLTRERDDIVGSAGLCYEAAEVARCITAGRRESRLLGWGETLSIMKTMDEIRRQIGVTLPGE
jgi:predicted dehydrogenase